VCQNRSPSDSWISTLKCRADDIYDLPIDFSAAQYYANGIAHTGFEPIRRTSRSFGFDS
jgi:hypothetical protein